MSIRKFFQKVSGGWLVRTIRHGWRTRVVKTRTLSEVTVDYNRQLTAFGHRERQLIDLHDKVQALEEEKIEELRKLKKLEEEAKTISEVEHANRMEEGKRAAAAAKPPQLEAATQ